MRKYTYARSSNNMSEVITYETSEPAAPIHEMMIFQDLISKLTESSQKQIMESETFWFDLLEKWGGSVTKKQPKMLPME